MNPQHAAETRLHEALTTATLDGTLTVNAADLAALCREVATTRRDLERLREVDRGIGTEQVLALAAAHDQLIAEHEQATEAFFMTTPNGEKVEQVVLAWRNTSQAALWANAPDIAVALDALSRAWEGKPMNADAYDRLLERAETAAAAGMPIEEALQAVRDGYSSAEADRAIAQELEDPT